MIPPPVIEIGDPAAAKADLEIVCGGDVAPLGRAEAGLCAGDLSLLGDLVPVLQRADLTLANLECPLTDSAERLPKVGAHLRAAPGVTTGLKCVGFQAFSLANNHITDCGASGLADTWTALESSGLTPVGAGRGLTAAEAPVFLTRGGLRIGILARAEREFNWPGCGAWRTATLDPAADAVRIHQYAQECDILIVLVHTGPEFHPFPSPRMRSLLRAFAESGAAVVVGGHGHTVIGAEVYAGALIAYGLGNLLFDWPPMFSRYPQWRLGTLLRISVANGRVVRGTFLPFTADKHIGMIHLIRGAELEQFTRYFQTLCEPLSSQVEIERLWEGFCAAEANRRLSHISKGLVGTLPGTILSMLPPSAARFLCRAGLQPAFTKGPAILRSHFTCENHVEIAATILELLRRNELAAARRVARELKQYTA